MERTSVEPIVQIYKKEKLSESKIIFLDRDGTLCKEGYIRSSKQIDILPTVAEGIRLINKNNIISAVVTNQPAVARGYITINTLKEINNKLVEILTRKDAYINAIYSCPHHPDFLKCKCRKPGILMFKKALIRYNNPKIVGIIGDQTRDIMAGKKIKVPTVLVKTGWRGKDGAYNVLPDFSCDNFLDAVKVLIK